MRLLGAMVGDAHVTAGQDLADEGEAALVGLEDQQILREGAAEGGVFDQSGGHAAHHVGALQIGGNGLAGGVEDVIEQVGGGGFAVGAGDEDHLVIVDIFEVLHKVGHELQRNLAGSAAALAGTEHLHRKGCEFGDPQCQQKFHRVPPENGMAAGVRGKIRRRFLKQKIGHPRRLSYIGVR